MANTIQLPPEFTIVTFKHHSGRSIHGCMRYPDSTDLATIEPSWLPDGALVPTKPMFIVQDDDGDWCGYADQIVSTHGMGEAW